MNSLKEKKNIVIGTADGLDHVIISVMLWKVWTQESFQK